MSSYHSKIRSDMDTGNRIDMTSLNISERAFNGYSNQKYTVPWLRVNDIAQRRITHAVGDTLLNICLIVSCIIPPCIIPYHAGSLCRVELTWNIETTLKLSTVLHIGKMLATMNIFRYTNEQVGEA